MRLKNLLSLLVVLNVIPTYAYQTYRLDTVKLFYDINQRELDHTDRVKLDSLNNFLKNASKVHVLGFTDYLGRNVYNDLLSKERAERVKKYLSLSHKNLLIVAEGRGELITTAKSFSAYGVPFNRRVEIIVTPITLKKKSLKKMKTSFEFDREQKSANNPLSDSTTFTSKNDRVYHKIDNLSNVDIGESLNFEELIFQPGRHFLKVEAIPYLDALSKHLKEYQKLRIEIQGHICCAFNKNDGLDLDTHQYDLSVNRAKFIYDYLVKSGINAKRMQYVGLGSSKPKIFPEKTSEDQDQNRRVQIVLLGK